MDELLNGHVARIEIMSPFIQSVNRYMEWYTIMHKFAHIFVISGFVMPLLMTSLVLLIIEVAVYVIWIFKINGLDSGFAGRALSTHVKWRFHKPRWMVEGEIWFIQNSVANYAFGLVKFLERLIWHYCDAKIALFIWVTTVSEEDWARDLLPLSRRIAQSIKRPNDDRELVTGLNLPFPTKTILEVRSQKTVLFGCRKSAL